MFYKNVAKKAAAKPRPSTGCTMLTAPDLLVELGEVEAPAVVPVDPEPVEPVADPDAVPEAEPVVTDGAV